MQKVEVAQDKETGAPTSTVEALICSGADQVPFQVNAAPALSITAQNDADTHERS